MSASSKQNKKSSTYPKRCHERNTAILPARNEMPNMEHLVSCVELRPSPIHGQGLFATRRIMKGTYVARGLPSMTNVIERSGAGNSRLLPPFVELLSLDNSDNTTSSLENDPPSMLGRLTKLRSGFGLVPGWHLGWRGHIGYRHSEVQQMLATFGGILPQQQQVRLVPVIAPAAEVGIACSPTPDDILFGRGRAIVDHPGNIRLLLLVEENKPFYDAANKEAKTRLSGTVVRILKGRSRGRFLKKRNATNGGAWEEVTDTLARNKVSHAFRTMRQSMMRNAAAAAAALPREIEHTARAAADCREHEIATPT